MWVKNQTGVTMIIHEGKRYHVCKHRDCKITMKVGYKFKNDVNMHNIGAYTHLFSIQHHCVILYL
jgi:hypothetical protein